MRERDSEPLPPALRDAVRTLRDDVEPTDIWRQRLLHEIAASPVPLRTVAARWSMRPWTAIAAGIACALIGASAATIAVRRSAPAPAPVAAMPASESVVRFTLVAPGAANVSLVGDFNGWSSRGVPLRRSRDGRTWEVEVPLAPGRYAYSFVVDGQLARDPSAPQVRDEDLGTTNSVVMVRSGS